MSYTDFRFYPITVFIIVFLAVVQFLLRRKQHIANEISKVILLLYSYYILIYYDYRYGIVLLAVTIITYFFAIVIGHLCDHKRKVAVGMGVTLLVLILAIFKYLNFFADTICSVIGTSWADINIILPLGISFYIFSAISYLLDVHWGGVKADRNFIDVALFLGFFPKLVCGPILKGKDFLPQLQIYKKIEWKNVCEGIQIFVFGFFKKIVLADHLAVFVDDIFEAPTAYSTATLWITVFSSFLQLYFDFSGYSDMAIGLFKILGYDVDRNFNLPFVSENISEFWDRWHISLSSWLNEYLFSPIAMKYKRKLAEKPKSIRKRYKYFPSYIAIMITFLLSGLWHGAGWTFVIWGLLHGLVSVVHQVYANYIKKKEVKWAINKKKWLYIMDIVLCYVCVNLIQIFFRADGVQQAFKIYSLLFTYHEGIFQPYTWTFFAYIILIVATIIAYKKSINIGKTKIIAYYPIQDLSTIKGLTIFFVICGLAIIMGYFGETYFIYGQF